MSKIEIFYSEMCGACHEAMDYFRSRGIEFESFEVEWDGSELKESDNSRELIRRCGKVDFVPQIFVGGGHVGGWADLSAMIDSGDLDAMLRA